MWETAIAAGNRNTGLDPSVVIEFVRQAISLVGNASFCGLSDRRKGLLAKISAESLDLLDNTSLFGKNSAELKFKHFSPLQSFQNGGYSPTMRSSSAGRLAGQNRPEGRLFCRTDLERSPELPPFSLERHPSETCLSPVWTSSSPEVVHKNYEARCCVALPVKRLNDNLLGRSVIPECIRGRTAAGYGHSPLPPGESRVCDQPREISVCSN